MRFEIFCLLALAVAVYTTSPVAPVAQEKSFITSAFSFTTFTLIKTTTTTTSTFTSVTTCTTSTSALTTCTVGRRRRGLFYDEGANIGRNRRGLFYNDEETENKDGTAFLPSDKTADPVTEVAKVSVTEDAVIPLEIQSGFALPEGVSTSRFLLAFGTYTLTSYSITTSTKTLTAICSSTTGFLVCGSGK